MLVTQWLDNDNRETRDIDFLGFGPDGPDTIKAIFAGIMAIEADDGLAFDVAALTPSAIREDTEYGGIRLRTSADLEKKNGREDVSTPVTNAHLVCRLLLQNKN